MKKTIAALIALAAAAAAFGDAVDYNPSVHGNPIVILGDEAVEIDGKGATIDAKGKSRCATLGPNVTIRNFVLKNGSAELGGGVYGGTVVDCTITGCRATESAAAICNATAVGCTVENNIFDNGSSTAAAHGGILFGSTLTNCKIDGNLVHFGSEAPAFGGIGERVVFVNCTLGKNNTVSCEDGVCYGYRFAASTVDGQDIEFDDGAKSSTIVKVPVDMSGVSFADATFVADGEAHELAISGDLPTGVTGVSYKGNGETKAGVYTVVARFDVDEYHLPVGNLQATLTIVDPPPPPPVFPQTTADDGAVWFGETSVTAEEGSNVIVRVCGGNTGLVASVQLQAVYNTAAAADLNLKKVKVDGIAQSSFKFPCTLTFRAGEETEHVIEIPVAADKLSETDEFFALQLKNPKNVRIVGAEGGRAGTCEVTIRGTKAPSAPQWYARAVANDVTRGTVSGSKAYRKGASVTFTAKPVAGNAFVGWNTNGVSVTTAASWSFKMPERDVEATAVFVPAAQDYLLFGAVVLPAELKLNQSVNLPLPVPTSLTRATVKVTGLPTGLKYDSKKSAITGKPTKASSKTETVTVTVTNLSGYKIVRKYQLKVVKGTPKEGRAKLASESKSMHAVTVALNDERVGKVTGAGVYAAGAKVTLKATAATGFVFTGWGTNGVNGVSRKPSWAFTMPSGAVMATAEFRPVAEDYLELGDTDFLPAELQKGVAVTDVLVPAADSLSLPTVTVSGLPSGLKYSATTRAITGKPKKTGTSKVTVTASNLSGFKIVRTYQVKVVSKTPKDGYAKLLSEGKPYFALTAQPDDVLAGKTSGTGVRQAGKKVTVKATALTGYVFSGWYEGESRKYRKESYSFAMPSRDVTLEARFVTKAADAASVGATVGGLGFGARGDGRTTVATNVYCGVRLSWTVAASSDSLPTVKVSGLPKGLSYKSGKITGVPTAASKTGKPSTVKVAVTTAGGAKKTYSIVLTVKNRESWARGTYTGKYVSGGVTNGTMTLTVATNGKVSGKIVRKSGGKTKTTTLTASAVTSRSSAPAEGGDVVTYLVEPAYKSGKTTVKVPLVLQLDPEGSDRGVAASEEGMDLYQKK